MGVFMVIMPTLYFSFLTSFVRSSYAINSDNFVILFVISFLLVLLILFGQDKCRGSSKR